MKYANALVMLALTLGACAVADAVNYQNFRVAVYLPVAGTIKMADPQWRDANWARLSSQLKFDKIYIETYRDGTMADESIIEPVKRFFVSHGIEVAGGLALGAGQVKGQFQSPSYTDPRDRAQIQKAVEQAARHFDEIILDDFFFNASKTPSDIAAKGDRSWTQFRLDLMDEVSRDLLLGPAHAVNPNCRIIIKFPNWYEHFQGLGYDLEQEPRLFAGIYTGTETRDPVFTEQHLQAYESYNIIRYFDNIAPGKNEGGWVDPYSVKYPDRYVEQLWDTLFARPPEITLFNFLSLEEPAQRGDRPWEKSPTSLDYDAMLRSYHPGEGAPRQPDLARLAGYALQTIDATIGQLGNPIGIASYRPYHATGEDFLYNYFGMLGIPINLQPEFPSDAKTILLTESAKFDPKIVQEIKQALNDGKSVMITSGLLRALQDRGIQDICECQCTDQKALVTWFQGPGGRRIDPGDLDQPILIPQIHFLTNDAWTLVQGMANGNGFPILFNDRYANGMLYVLTIPDNFNDLYRYPVSVLSAIHRVLLKDFPVCLDGPAQVSLFAYDNDTFIVESFRPDAVKVTISVPGQAKNLSQPSGGAAIEPAPPATQPLERRRSPEPPRTGFTIEIPPHSFRLLRIER